MTEIPVPEQTRIAEHQAFRHCLEQCILADQLGYDHFWTVEHHFLGGFSHSSAPETLSSYLAAKTERIRIGHGVRLLPYPPNHSVRVAEQAATLDIVAGGRLEFGIGRSISWELSGFGIDPAETHSMFEEALEVIVGCWTEDVFSHQGRHFNLPPRPRRVVPKPMQDPHPPLWAAATGPESHEIAGRLGVGLLSLTLATPLDEVRRRIELYKAQLAQATPVGKFINDRIGTFVLTHVAETDDEARETAAEAVATYLRSGLELVGSLFTRVPALNPSSDGDGPSAGPAASYDHLAEMLSVPLEDITYDYLVENNMVVVGSPSTCAEQVANFADCGITTLFPMMAVHDIPQEKVLRSIRLFAQNVMPKYR